MQDSRKTKAQLIDEMAAMRRETATMAQRITECEAREAEHRRTKQVQAALYHIADTAGRHRGGYAGLLCHHPPDCK